MISYDSFLVYCPKNMVDSFGKKCIAVVSLVAFLGRTRPPPVGGGGVRYGIGIVTKS